MPAYEEPPVLPGGSFLLSTVHFCVDGGTDAVLHHVCKLSRLHIPVFLVSNGVQEGQPDGHGVAALLVKGREAVYKGYGHHGAF